MTSSVPNAGPKAEEMAADAATECAIRRDLDEYRRRILDYSQRLQSSAQTGEVLKQELLQATRERDASLAAAQSADAHSKDLAARAVEIDRSAQSKWRLLLALAGIRPLFAAPRLRVHIDSHAGFERAGPDKYTAGATGAAVLEGWIVGPPHIMRGADVFIQAGDLSVKCTRLPRPDVSAQFGSPDDIPLGFRAEFDLARLGVAATQIEISAENGGRRATYRIGALARS
jgi:hypothetical protein